MPRTRASHPDDEPAEPVEEETAVDPTPGAAVPDADDASPQGRYARGEIDWDQLQQELSTDSPPPADPG